MTELSEKKLIAVGVNLDGHIWEEHLGMAPQFYIYDLTGRLLEKRPNPYGANVKGSKHHGNPKLIVELLPECGVFIARAMGKAGQLKDLGINPVITQAPDPDAAVKSFLGNG
ncbi:MAG: hypothetical protein CSB13_10665 [Chloroflexi bacterium]|nr:MAG: hypothetical protein CSB13_10665 [Chloroflexota bacterium]